VGFEIEALGSETVVGYEPLPLDSGNGSLAYLSMRWETEGDVHTLELNTDHVPLESDPVWAAYSKDVRTFRKAHAGETWGSMMDRVREEVQRVEGKVVPLEQVQHFCEFRLRMLQRVQRRYELLGSVAPLAADLVRSLPTDEQDGAPSAPYEGELPYNIDRVLFIVLAYAAVRSNPNMRLNTLLSGPKGEIGGIDGAAIEVLGHRHGNPISWPGDPDGGKGKAKYFAERDPIAAYHSGLEPEEMRRRFDARIVQLYEEISSLGYTSVEDVLWRIDFDNRDGAATA
jgi:hypothetical protein